jgi:hypothetical protein
MRSAADEQAMLGGSHAGGERAEPCLELIPWLSEFADERRWCDG